MSGRIPTPVPRYESGGDDEIAQEICELLKEMQTKMERDRSRCEDEHRESEECLHKIIVELKENIQLCKLLSSFKGLQKAFKELQEENFQLCELLKNLSEDKLMCQLRKAPQHGPGGEFEPGPQHP